MKQRIDPYKIVERVIVGALVIFTLAAAGLLVFSLVRQRALDRQLQESLGALQETTTELQDTVDEIRSAVADPTVAADLEVIEEQLEEVDQQLETLEQEIVPPETEPVDEGAPTTRTIEEIEAAQEDFDELVTASSWLVGILSILTALALARVLGARWRRKRRHLTVVDPATFLSKRESDHFEETS